MGGLGGDPELEAVMIVLDHLLDKTTFWLLLVIIWLPTSFAIGFVSPSWVNWAARWYKTRKTR